MNIQNWPKKNNSYIRRQIKAPKGHLMVCVDFGQIQARNIAMLSKDKRFVEALFKDYDIHMVWTKKVINAYPEVVNLKSINTWQDLEEIKLSKFRDKIKNKLVFPWFFLSSYKSTARDLSVPINVMENIYNEFWEYFEGVRKWQKTVIAHYKKYGYVEDLLGRRRHAPINYTELSNTPVQGMEVAIVSDTMNELSRTSYMLNKPQIQPIMNQHDDLPFYIPNETLEEDIELIAKIMVKPRFDWINVPLTVEISVGRNWNDQEKICTMDTRDFYPKFNVSI